MATNYKVVETRGKFVVQETQTGHEIYSSLSREDARNMMKHLNLGGSFDGFTPDFFMKKFEKLVAAD